MKKLSTKGILLSILIMSESVYQFLYSGSSQVLFPTGKTFFLFSFITGIVLFISLLCRKKKISFICLILWIIYIIYSLLYLLFFAVHFEEKLVGILSSCIFILWIFFIWKDIK